MGSEVRPFRVRRSARARRRCGGRGRPGRDRGHAGADEGRAVCSSPGWTETRVREGEKVSSSSSIPSGCTSSTPRLVAELRGRTHLSTFVLIHGGGDVGWYRHLVEAELRKRGHDVVAPTCRAMTTRRSSRTTPIQWSRPSVTGRIWSSWANVRRVHRAPGCRSPRSRCAGARGRNDPVLGESPGDWWKTPATKTRCRSKQRDGGLTGNDDPYVSFYHDVPRELAEEAMSKERAHPSQASMASWPLDAWPNVPTRFVPCTDGPSRPTSFAGWSRSV